MIAVERVRAAATELRDLAKAATPAPWWVHDQDDTDLWAGDQAAIREVDGHRCCPDPASKNCTGHCEDLFRRADPLAHGNLKRGADTALIALQDPGYALLVADLLDLLATRFETMPLEVPGWATARALSERILHQTQLALPTVVS